MVRVVLAALLLLSAVAGCRAAIDCSRVPPPHPLSKRVGGEKWWCEQQRKAQQEKLKKEKEDRTQAGEKPSPWFDALEKLLTADPDKPLDENSKKAVKAVPTTSDISGAVGVVARESAALAKRQVAQSGGAEPAAQLDVAVTTLPRRSEGWCKFIADVTPDPLAVTPGLVCDPVVWKDKEQRIIEVADLQAIVTKLLNEYDRKCGETKLNEDPKLSETLDDGYTFFAECGAKIRFVTSFTNPNSFQVQLLRDSTNTLALLNNESYS